MKLCVLLGVLIVILTAIVKCVVLTITSRHYVVTSKNQMVVFVALTINVLATFVVEPIAVKPTFNLLVVQNVILMARCSTVVFNKTSA